MTDFQVTRALSMIQPWGTAILTLGKDVENRNWPPPSAMIGKRIALHAGQKVDKADAWGLMGELAGLDLSKVPKSALIGTVQIVGFVRPDLTGESMVSSYPLCMEALQSKWRSPDAKCMWTVREPRVFETPIPCKGALGLWRIPAELLEEVNRA